MVGPARLLSFWFSGMPGQVYVEVELDAVDFLLQDLVSAHVLTGGQFIN